MALPGTVELGESRSFTAERRPANRARPAYSRTPVLHPAWVLPNRGCGQVRWSLGLGHAGRTWMSTAGGIAASCSVNARVLWRWCGQRRSGAVRVGDGWSGFPSRTKGSAAKGGLAQEVRSAGREPGL